MLKKLIGFLVFLLLVISVSAEWKAYEQTDEFGELTGSKYLYNEMENSNFMMNTTNGTTYFAVIHNTYIETIDNLILVKFINEKKERFELNGFTYDSGHALLVVINKEAMEYFKKSKDIKISTKDFQEEIFVFQTDLNLDYKILDK